MVDWAKRSVTESHPLSGACVHAGQSHALPTSGLFSKHRAMGMEMCVPVDRSGGWAGHLLWEMFAFFS